MATRYAEQDKDLALKDAKAAESRGKATKIVRDVTLAGSRASEENTVYLSRNLIEVQAALSRGASQARLSGAAARNTIFDEAPVSSRRPPSAVPASSSRGIAPIVKGPKSSVDLALRAFGIGIASILVAGFATILASMFLAQMSNTGSGVSSSSYSSILFGVFLGTFTLTAIPLVLAFIGLSDAPVNVSSEPSWWQLLWTSGKKIKSNERNAFFLDFSTISPSEVPVTTSGATEAVPPATPEPEPEPPAGFPFPEITPEPQVLENTPGMEMGRASLMRFLGGAVAIIKGANAQFDPYSKFGMHLIIAGAADTLGKQSGLDVAQRLRLTHEALEVLGAKGNLAQNFCEKLEEYFQTPRYLAMVQAGSTAMQRMLDKDTAPYNELIVAMKDWNAPPPAAPSQNIITVMFTDMVGSTSITQDRGDELAQILVRTHNSIVRGALKDFGGREIKHTGDGIMASFNSTSSAVEATIAIQQAVVKESKDLNLHLRIGLNAGEPIQEEDDLFGTTVQLAARICAKADLDQIFVSNVVRELSAGKPLRFVPKGLFELKGVKEPQALYEVIWRIGDLIMADAPIPASPLPSPTQDAVSDTLPQAAGLGNPFAPPPTIRR
ncbi:MAG: adenylate/guanylate cyclase domain-containing protein [Alphaproteobacteria bacterium]|nr:adenylate/guanylate cyclase domain-containing protein [Alphaproteobacteria bacterium]